MARIMEKRSNKIKMELLSAVLQNGYTHWEWDERTKEMIGHYEGWQDDENNGGPYATVFWVDEDENGVNWIYFRDMWPDGCVMTGVGTLCQIEL